MSDTWAHVSGRLFLGVEKATKVLWLGCWGWSVCLCVGCFCGNCCWSWSISKLVGSWVYVCVCVCVCVCIYIYIFTILLFQWGDDLRLAEAGEGWCFVSLILKWPFLGVVSLLTGVTVANCSGFLRVLDPPSSFLFNVICLLTSSHPVLGSRDLKTNKQTNFKYSCRYFLDVPDMIFLSVCSHLVSLTPMPRLLALF